jgi:hypothetical protein
MLSESPAEITIHTRNEDPHVFLLAMSDFLVREQIKSNPDVETSTSGGSTKSQSLLSAEEN